MSWDGVNPWWRAPMSGCHKDPVVEKKESNYSFCVSSFIIYHYKKHIKLVFQQWLLYGRQALFRDCGQTQLWLRIHKTSLIWNLSIKARTHIAHSMSNLSIIDLQRAHERSRDVPHVLKSSIKVLGLWQFSNSPSEYLTANQHLLRSDAFKLN